ncbi:MAG: YkgJ family cysteine cluster protein [Lachnospiraceae bacterium]|nr:YkgJ family cysteine cluster protein [Lachnospiraceae bacterium]
MIRDINMEEISDGKRYRSADMVKIGCAECKGCSECCRLTDDTIILDPYDIYELCRGLNTTFDSLLNNSMIELGIADGLMLPHLKVDTDGHGCTFLSPEGRCTIHSFRPGFCRLYPLGRIYENGSFSYFLQINECPYPNKTKVKIKKWLGIENLSEYEAYIMKWHKIHAKAREEAALIHDHRELSGYLAAFLRRYFQIPYDLTRPFHEQFTQR